jgi:hypothetical protein
MDRKIVFVVCLTLIIGIIALGAISGNYLGPDYWWIALIIYVAAIIGIIYGGVIYLERQRKKEMDSFARQMGFHYVGDTGLETGLSAPLFEKGHSRKIKNLVEGHKDGINWRIFDYYYTEGYGKNSVVHIQTLIIPQLKSGVPEFTLRPENIFHKIGNIFGYKDIDFDNYPEFSKKYLLKGKHDADVRKAFSPEVIRIIEKLEKKICLESDSKSLVCYLANQRMKPSEISSNMSALAEIVNLWNNKKSNF